MMVMLRLAKCEVNFSIFATLDVNIWNGGGKLPLKIFTSIRKPHGGSLDFILLRKKIEIELINPLLTVLYFHVFEIETVTVQ